MTVLAFDHQPPSIILPSPRLWLAGVAYDPSDARAHTCDGAPILSITQLLRLAGKSSEFLQVQPTVLEHAGRRGTAAHLAAHFFDEGDLVEASVDPRVACYLAAWQRFRTERGFIPELLETVVVSRRFGYIGRFDRVGTVDNRRRRVLLDIKTGDPDASRADLQTVGYELALIEECGSAWGVLDLERWAVRLLPDGRYRVCEYPTSGRTWRHDRDEFLEAVNDAQVLRGRTTSMTPLHLVLPTADPDPDPPDVAFVLAEPSDLPEPDLRPEPDADPLDDPAIEPLVADDPPMDPPGLVADAAPIVALITVPDGMPTPEALVLRKDDLIARSRAIVVHDEQSYQSAILLAQFIDDVLKEAHAWYDPRVELALRPWQQACADRRAVIDELETEKKALVGSGGKAPSWRLSVKAAAEAEQRRQQQEADDRAEAERTRLALEAQATRDAARAAQTAGDTARAAELAHQATETALSAARVTAEVKTVTAAVPKVAGAVEREKWTYRMPNFQEFVCAQARPRILRQLSQELAKGGAPANVIASIDWLVGQCPDIPLAAIEENDAYLRTRAKADRATLNGVWPGIHFYDEGNTALTGSGGSSRRRTGGR